MPQRRWHWWVPSGRHAASASTQRRQRLFDKIDRGTTEHRLARDESKMSPSPQYPQIEFSQSKSNISLIVSILRCVSMANVRHGSLTLRLANG